MLDRKATVTITLTVFGFGGGVALAATQGGSHAAAHPAHAQVRAPKLVPGLVKVHVCHPGRAGSMLDSLN